jgi:hypothetical protein
MPSAWRSPLPLSTRTFGAARPWSGLLLSLLLASCFDSKRIVFESDAGGVEQAAAVTADVPAAEITPAASATPAANATPVGVQTPAGEAATAPDDALSAEAAAVGAAIADIDPGDSGSPVPSDAAP